MQPLNPFLAAFFKHGNPIAAQCTPVHHHILLVPATEYLLTSRETESGLSRAELLGSEDFLGSHVLRVPSPSTAAGGKDSLGNLRELKGKARPYTTVNGRSVVVKDNTVYSNKGFKSLTTALLLGDAIWYADTIEPRQWLIYYISRPLVGTWDEIQIEPAIFVDGIAKKQKAEADRRSATENGEPSLPKKKEIKSFHDLLNHFPLIARQMHPGLETLFSEFNTVFDKPLPPPPSSSHIPDPAPDGPIAAAVKKARYSSPSGRKANDDEPQDDYHTADDEDVVRASSETAVTTAIDTFQAVDKQQLSMLGATTDLTGPVVERLIEKYVAENIHNLIWTRIVSMRRQDDLELEAKIRQTEYIDISQLGIALDGRPKEKHELSMRLAIAVDDFRKMNTAMSPQDMLEVLLSTMKTVAQLTEQPRTEVNSGVHSEKPLLTINADSLVSLLLFVVIRAGVKHLQARLLYIRHFIFIDDVDSGEMGYALSTFEAVLSYLFRDSAGLRRASRRNKALWDAASNGHLNQLKNMMDPNAEAIEDDEEESPPRSPISSRAPSVSWSLLNGSSRRTSGTYATSEVYSKGSGLSHVFPFQSDFDSISTGLPVKRAKKVAMDTRSMSSGSEYSYHSRATSVATLGSGIEADTSVERLCQTENATGDSIPMMAVQNGRAEVLKYLLSLEEYYPFEVVIEDTNNDGTTLMSAAVSLGHTDIIETILDYVVSRADTTKVKQYFALQDIWGRSIAHYLFHAPALIGRIGNMLPWRQRDKNGQTPLFALCRSYDHTDYFNMVEAGLEVAARTQGDGLPLHVDDHVDMKGNTLLHIVNDYNLVLKMLHFCDVDVNAVNEKKFTPLMVASKYGRFDMVRVLYADQRVDFAAKDLRGLTAVELAKDDDVRNRIDDLTLFTMSPSEDGRITGVVRSFFVEDATIRLVLKSGAPADASSYTVTTCRRSMADFERLMNLLTLENPASWMPNISNQRSPFQIPSKPSRAVLRDIQIRTNSFLRILLAHPTFSTHEMLWEFFLVPDLQADMMEQRSRLKAETRIEKVREELEPLEDSREVEQFVEHARDMVRSVNYSTKSVARRAHAVSAVSNDLYDAANILSSRGVVNLPFLPKAHINAFASYVQTLASPQQSPFYLFHSSFLSLQSTIQAMLTALSRPPQIIASINTSRKSVERSYNSLSRSTRWPLGLLDETRQRLNDEREEKARRVQTDVDNLGKELRYTQQVVASELAGWQDMHERLGRRALRELARGMLVLERERLNGMTRALRRLREGNDEAAAVAAAAAVASAPTPSAAEVNGLFPPGLSPESNGINGASSSGSPSTSAAGEVLVDETAGTL